MVCDKEWCERRAAGGGRQRQTGAEQKTRTPHNDVGKTGIIRSMAIRNDDNNMEQP